MPRPTDVNDHATAESRRKGALVANEKRRQQGLSLRARVAEELEKQAGELVAATLDKAKGGDWQAFLALWKQTHGAPPVEITGEDGAPLEVHVDHDYGNLVDKLEQAGVIQRGPTATPDA